MENDIMSNHKKMKISDLNPATREVDYTDIDELMYQTCKEALSVAYVFSTIIINNKIIELEGIDPSKIVEFMRAIEKDQHILQEKYNEMVVRYEEGKKRNKTLDSEDYHMFMLSMGQEATDWLMTFQNTIGDNVNDTVEYINESMVDKTKNIQSPVENVGV